MENIVIAGIDYSMTSPAICVHDGSDSMSFDRCSLYYISRQKRLIDKFGKNIQGNEYPPHKTDMERFIGLSKWSMNILQKHKVTHVFLEGYSMGSKGKVFHIAENTAMLKVGIHLAGIELESVPPTTIKKFATGKGNSDKVKMFSCFHEYEPGGVDLQQMITPNKKTIGNPVSDIVDAYFICKYGFEQLRDRK